MRKVAKDFWVEGNRRVKPKRPVKLTNKDFKLLWIAIDICASDYDIWTNDDSEPPAYRVKMQKDLSNLLVKLAKLQEQMK